MTINKPVKPAAKSNSATTSTPAKKEPQEARYATEMLAVYYR